MKFRVVWTDTRSKYTGYGAWTDSLTIARRWADNMSAEYPHIHHTTEEKDNDAAKDNGFLLPRWD